MYGGRRINGVQPSPHQGQWFISPQPSHNYNRSPNFRHQSPLGFSPPPISLLPTPLFPPQNPSFASRLMQQPRKILNAFKGSKNRKKKKGKSNDSHSTTPNENQKQNLKRGHSTEGKSNDSHSTTPNENQKQNLKRGHSTEGKSNDSHSSTPNKKQKQDLKRGHSTETSDESESKRRKGSDGESASANDKSKYDKFTEQIERHAQRHSQSEDLLIKKLQLRSALLNLIKTRFPGVSLHLVGSSCNGFASDSSDADFCIMITQTRDVNQKHEARFYLKTVERLIRPMRHFRSMQFIPAKVPILKFKDTVSGCECDININNAVGIRNTHLLRTYSKVDRRVQPMVMALKKWGKARGINDASQGTLSSYSLVLMIIHYLQTGCTPPVLDSLQQKYPNFFPVDSNVNDLPMFEPANMMPCNDSENKQPVGQLIEGFFQYYDNFSWDSKIISIRLGTLIQKKNQFAFKDKYISIEEPFEHTNTARAVHELIKFKLIKKEFQRAHQRLKEQLSLDYIQ